MGELRLEELSPRGAGAISVLQLVGPGALQRASGLCARELPLGTFALVRLRVAGEDLDEALVLVHDAQHVELHVHGSPPLVTQLFSALGVSRARRGARTLEQRAEGLLGAAPCEAGARILLDQAQGALCQRLARWAELADDELEREYLALHEDSAIAQRALEPTRVLLAGPVNAGKSTLFNALFGSERVITSEAAGTTRDLIVERVSLAGWPVDLIDTAGERGLDDSQPKHTVELAGQRLARSARESAELMFWLRAPGDEGAAPQHEGLTIVELRTKGDLAPGTAEAISATTQPHAAARFVAQHFCEALRLPERAWTPGLGVLFDATSRAWLEELAGATAVARRAAAAELCAGLALRE